MAVYMLPNQQKKKNKESYAKLCCSTYCFLCYCFRLNIVIVPLVYFTSLLQIFDDLNCKDKAAVETSFFSQFINITFIVE